MDSDDLVRQLIENAKVYSAFVDKELIFVYREGRNGSYHSAEIFFGKEYFMHLVGVDSSTYSAGDFYDACINKSVTIQDCSPSHGNHRDRNRKIKRFKDLFRFSNSKLYRIGEKDASTLYNDFQIMTGNNEGVIGYDDRDKTVSSLIPITLLDKKMSNYCTKPEKILAVVEKHHSEIPDIVLYECTKGFYNSFTSSLLK